MGLLAQGVPIIDSRLSNFISRLVEQAEDAVKQGEKQHTLRAQRDRRRAAGGL